MLSLPRPLIADADCCRWWLPLYLPLQCLRQSNLSRLPETLSWTRVPLDAVSNGFLCASAFLIGWVGIRTHLCDLWAIFGRRNAPGRWKKCRRDPGVRDFLRRSALSAVCPGVGGRALCPLCLCGGTAAGRSSSIQTRRGWHRRMKSQPRQCNRNNAGQSQYCVRSDVLGQIFRSANSARPDICSRARASG